MTKQVRRKAKAGRASRNRGGGRVEPRPPWESVWRRASGEAPDLWWLPDPGSAHVSEMDDIAYTSHGSVFRVLDAMASAADGLSTLAVLADVFDQTDGVVDVEAQLRAVADQVTDRSEAALLSGYLSPDTASAADSSAVAGRLLRGFRERDLVEMVAAANANPQVFMARPYVGVLTLAPLLMYEFTRADDAPPLNDHVADFLDDCDLPIAGVGEVLDLVMAGLLVQKAPGDVDAPFASEIAGRVVGDRLLVDRFLACSLVLEATMNSSKTAASLHQCGARLGASFAGKAALVATLASETPALRRFQDHEPPPRSAYGMWRAWLANSSPKGFTHRSIGLFSPDDLVTAALAPLDKGPLERVRRTLSLQSPLTGDAFEEASGMLEQRVDWLNSLAAVLIGDSQPLETFMRILGNNLESWGLFGPAGPATAAQEIYLVIVAIQELNDLSAYETPAEYEEMRDSLLHHGALASARIATAVAEGRIADDEVRSLAAWLELLTEATGVEAVRPPDDFDVTNVPEDLEVWLAHTCWWVKHRGWRPSKERPVIEEIEMPVEATAAVPPEAVAPLEEVFEELVPNGSVRIVFVGGDERQAKNDAHIDRDVSDRHGGLVQIEWVHIDWSVSPGRYADKVVGRVKHGADVVILMPLVRTGTGAQIRRESGELGVPWVACTGRGRASVNASVDEAVQVVCRLRVAR